VCLEPPYDEEHFCVLNDLVGKEYVSYRLTNNSFDFESSAEPEPNLTSTEIQSKIIKHLLLSDTWWGTDWKASSFYVTKPRIVDVGGSGIFGGKRIYTSRAEIEELRLERETRSIYPHKESFISLTTTFAGPRRRSVLGQSAAVFDLTIPARETVSPSRIMFPPLEVERENVIDIIPMKVISRDRMLAGSIRQIGVNTRDLKLRFKHKGTGENLGTYGNFHTVGGEPYIYRSDRQMFNEQELQDYHTNSLDSRILTEDVVFCRTKNSSEIEFYTVFQDLGDIEIEILKGEQVLTSVEHTLEKDQSFSNIIDYMDDVISNSPVNDTVVAAAQPSRNALLSNQISSVQIHLNRKIHPLTKRVMVPIFNGMGAWIGGQTDVEALLFGLIDGIKQGAIDDWKLITLLREVGGQAALAITDNLPALLRQEAQRWQNDPYKA